MKIRESVGYLIEKMKRVGIAMKPLAKYNQMYADALLIRQLQDEESNSLEQRIDAFIKKRELINNSKKSLLNSPCVQNPHEHKQSMSIDPISYDSDKIKRQKHRRCCQTTSHEYCNVEQIPIFYGDNGNPPSSHNGSSISGNSEVSIVYIVCL